MNWVEYVICSCVTAGHLAYNFPLLNRITGRLVICLHIHATNYCTQQVFRIYTCCQSVVNTLYEGVVFAVCHSLLCGEMNAYLCRVELGGGNVSPNPLTSSGGPVPDD